MDSATPSKARELGYEGGWNNFVILTASFYLWLLDFDLIESDSKKNELRLVLASPQGRDNGELWCQASLGDNLDYM